MENGFKFCSFKFNLYRCCEAPVWVAWGTDWGDAPLINARALAAEVGEGVALDWAAAQKERARSGGVAGLFAKASASASASAAGAGAGT